MSGAYHTANATVSAHSAAVVTPSDSVDIPVTRALYVGVGGNIQVTMADDENTIVFVVVVDGSILPIQVSRVWVTNTTATNIIALN